VPFLPLSERTGAFCGPKPESTETKRVLAGALYDISMRRVMEHISSYDFGFARCLLHDEYRGGPSKTKRAEKLALLVATQALSSLFPISFGHLVFAQGAEAPTQRHASQSFFAMPSTFYIRTASDLPPMRRVHGLVIFGAAVRTQKRAENRQKRMELCQKKLGRQSPPSYYLVWYLEAWDER